MDRRELKYDADGYLVLVNTKEDLIGVYFGTGLIKTFWVKTGYECIMQTVYKIDELEDIVFVMQYVPEKTPVVVY